VASRIVINANDGQPQHHLRQTEQAAATLLDCYAIALPIHRRRHTFPPSIATRFCRLLRLPSGIFFFLHFPRVAEVAIIHTAV
jgi:hypothetical protein